MRAGGVPDSATAPGPARDTSGSTVESLGGVAEDTACCWGVTGLSVAQALALVECPAQAGEKAPTAGAPGRGEGLWMELGAVDPWERLTVLWALGRLAVGDTIGLLGLRMGPADPARSGGGGARSKRHRAAYTAPSRTYARR